MKTSDSGRRTTGSQWQFWVDRAGTFTDFHAPDWHDLYVPAERIIGARVVDLLPPDIAARTMVAVETALTTRSLEVFEYTLPSDKGDQDFEARLVPSSSDEVLTLIRNVTSRRLVLEATRNLAALEERAQVQEKLLQVQKSESLGLLAGGIAHDFNNLLTAIMGHASVALLNRAMVQLSAGQMVAAAELLRHGVSADVVLSGEMATASVLATELMRFLGPSSERRRVLFPQAAEGRDELPNLLRAAGLSIERLAAYRTVAVSVDELQPAAGLLRAGQVDLVPLGSPRTAQVLLHALGRDASQVLSHALVGAIGQTTGSALRELNVRVDVVAEQPSFEDLIEKLAAVQKRS